MFDPVTMARTPKDRAVAAFERSFGGAPARLVQAPGCRRPGDTMNRTLQLRHPHGIGLVIATRGAAWLSCEVPLRDGHQGYPRELHAQVVYRLLDALTIEMEATATVTAASPVCLTNHAYFQLDGRVGDARAHRLRIASRHFAPVDGELIPRGALA